MSIARICKECGKLEMSDKPHAGCHKPKEIIHIKSVAELEGESDRKRGLQASDYAEADKAEMAAEVEVISDSQRYCRDYHITVTEAVAYLQQIGYLLRSQLAEITRQAEQYKNLADDVVRLDTKAVKMRRSLEAKLKDAREVNFRWQQIAQERKEQLEAR